MATRTRIQPLNREFELALREDLEPEARSQRFAMFAQEEIDKAAEENRKALGREPRRKVFVDGREGAPLDSVTPAGVITATFELVDDVLVWIGEQLLRASPRRSGRYERSHILLADGDEIDPKGTIPSAVEYVFVSTQPYARKIEGDGFRSASSSQAPDGVYEVVAAMANQRFGNIARIKFGWRSLSSSGASALEAWAGNTGLQKNDRTLSGQRRADWLRRQPSIVVSVG